MIEKATSSGPGFEKLFTHVQMHLAKVINETVDLPCFNEAREADSHMLNMAVIGAMTGLLANLVAQTPGTGEGSDLMLAHNLEQTINNLRTATSTAYAAFVAQDDGTPEHQSSRRN